MKQSSYSPSGKNVWTPLHLILMLSYRCGVELWPSPQAPAVGEYRAQLLREGLIERTEVVQVPVACFLFVTYVPLHIDLGWRLTPEGDKFLTRMLNTPTEDYLLDSLFKAAEARCIELQKQLSDELVRGDKLSDRVAELCVDNVALREKIRIGRTHEDIQLWEERRKNAAQANRIADLTSENEKLKKDFHPPGASMDQKATAWERVRAIVTTYTNGNSVCDAVCNEIERLQKFEIETRAEQARKATEGAIIEASWPRLYRYDFRDGRRIIALASDNFHGEVVFSDYCPIPVGHKFDLTKPGCTEGGWDSSKCSYARHLPGKGEFPALFRAGDDVAFATGPRTGKLLISVQNVYPAGYVYRGDTDFDFNTSSSWDNLYMWKRDSK